MFFFKKKTQVSYQGSLGPRIYCIITYYYIILNFKCCFRLKCLLYLRHFLNMAVPLQVIAKHAFLKIFLNVKMSDVEVKMKKMWHF